jgi:hypothetical protein
MSEKNSHVNPLESRKRLLLAESELNRAQLVEDLGALKSDVNALVDHVKSFKSIASSAAVLVSGLAAFQREKPANGDGKSHWPRRLIKGAGLIFKLWRAFRPKRRDPKEAVGRGSE